MGCLSIVRRNPLLYLTIAICIRDKGHPSCCSVAPPTKGLHTLSPKILPTGRWSQKVSVYFARTDFRQGMKARDRIKPMFVDCNALKGKLRREVYVDGKLTLRKLARPTLSHSEGHQAMTTPTGHSPSALILSAWIFCYLSATPFRCRTALTRVDELSCLAASMCVTRHLLIATRDPLASNRESGLES